MGGLTPFPHSQYETIARSSIDDCWRLSRSRQRRNTTEQQHGIVVGSPELSYEKCWKNTNTPLKPVPKEGNNLVRRNSASDVTGSTDSKQNRRFVSSKVLLELRSNYKTGNRTDSTFVGSSSLVDGSIKSKLSNKGSSPFRAYSVGTENNFPSNGDRKSFKSQDLDNERSIDATCAKPCFLLEKHMHTYGESSNMTQTRTTQQPTKTVLQLQNRISRTNSIDVSCKMNLKENQLSSERPAYARRFMLNHTETVVPILSRPSNDEGLTPLFNGSEKLKEPPHFVLPPLPLGLRPPSPEPRNLLLNAPKKRRFSCSNAFDLSCLGRMLKPCQSKSHAQKRPVCRALRFGD